jgi:hypothetical protein
MPLDESKTQLAERVRNALIACALDAHEDAGIRGLCCEGAWEAVVNALRSFDLSPVLGGMSDSASARAGDGVPPR